MHLDFCTRVRPKRSTTFVIDPREYGELDLEADVTITPAKANEVPFQRLQSYRFATSLRFLAMDVRNFWMISINIATL
jgi:hypothetical protein